MIKLRQTGQVNLLLLLAIFLGIGMVLFGTLAVVAYGQRTEAQENLNSKVNQAVIKAKESQKRVTEEEFAKANQLPYRIYTADQADGGFQLQIPKNWSAYAERSSTGNVQLLFIASQDAVTVNKSGINTHPFKAQLIRQPALDLVKKYNDDIKKKKVNATTVKVSGIDSTRIEGKIDDRHEGVILMVPVRDKALVFTIEDKKFLTEFNEIISKAKINP